MYNNCFPNIIKIHRRESLKISCDKDVSELMKQIDIMVEGQVKIVKQETAKLKDQLSLRENEIRFITNNSEEKDIEV